MTLGTKRLVQTRTIWVEAWAGVTTTKDGNGLSQPSSDFTGRAAKHPAKDFQKEAETRNANKDAGGEDHLSVKASLRDRSLDLIARGPWAMAAVVALAVISVSFVALIFYLKGR